MRQKITKRKKPRKASFKTSEESEQTTKKRIGSRIREKKKKIRGCIRALLNEAGSKSRKYAKSSKKLVVKCFVKVGERCVCLCLCRYSRKKSEGRD